MPEEKLLTIEQFYGGIARDDKSKTPGVCSNAEEIDIFSNANFFQAEQIFSADTLPDNTEVYAYCSDKDDQVWGYGANTSGSNEVRLVKVTSGGGSNPGSFSTVATSADTTDIAYTVSPITYFRQDNGNQDFLYYCTNASGTVKLKSYDITGDSESEQDSGATNMTLSGLDGSYDRISMKVFFGELYITNGQYIAKVDKDGVYTDKAFTLPNGWEAVDIIPVSDVGIILARDINRNSNISKGFWWDLTTSTQVDDSFTLPMGGPQWIVNHKENIRIMCSINGEAAFFQLSGAFPGAVPIEMPGIRLSNCITETSTTQVSAPKTVSVKGRIQYFGINKTDKTGVYAIGQLDSDKPNALVLSKRYTTTDYADHTGYALHILGPNFYATYDDNGTFAAARCESNNSPARSSQAVYESIVIDDGDPLNNKQIPFVYVNTKPLAASTDVDVSTAADYGSYAEIFRADETSFTGTNAIQGKMHASHADIKSIKIKLELTSNSTNSPQVTSIGLLVAKQRTPAHQ